MSDSAQAVTLTEGERAHNATLAPVEALSEAALRQAVIDLRGYIGAAKKPAKSVAPAMATLGLPPGTNVELRQTPDGIVREVVRVGYRVHHVPEVELEACKCGARFSTPDESMVALARKRQELIPAICHSCGALIVGESKLVELVSH